MGKALAILGLLLMIVGILPLILPMIGYGAYASYFFLGIYSLDLAGYLFSELMLILLIVGFLMLIIGALK
ncbi:hypothetical protein E4H12_14740 [Candidatus Thorarchaeota archaeon]|nr:hypothetical protein [Candidatus Thorarchaeota archaeon]TFG94686.1 MAG: hypothetical protein E4H12_14740 [Candidatus Thorarchaeota archaeon]